MLSVLQDFQVLFLEIYLQYTCLPMTSVKVAPKAPFALENSSSKTRDDSFSTYLALVRDNFPPPEPGNSAPEHLSCQISLNRRRTLDGEIEIFDAEKYFSGVMDTAASKAPEQVLGTLTKKEVRVRVVRSPDRTGSGSSASEASSCDSRSTLLRDHHRKHAPAGSQRDTNTGKRFLSVLPCSSCARKNSIDVINKEAMPDRKKQQEHQQNVEHLVGDARLKRISPSLKQELIGFPPNLNPVTGKLVPVKRDFKIEGEIDGIASAQRRSVGGRDDDVRSEASSDLFEIESISMNSHLFVAGSESMTTTVYEPSEASVEWSVATASVANFSIASESDEQAAGFLRTRRSSGSTALLGCVSEKAVNVTAGHAARMPERLSFERSGLEGAVAPTARYRVESCGVDLGSGRAGRVRPTSPFGSSRSSQD